MQKAQTRNTENSYENILAAVGRIAKTQSYSKMTVRQICKEAGVATGTFYHFFSGKADLISSHLRLGQQERADNLQCLLQHGDAIDKLRVFAENYAAMNLEAGLEELKSLFSPSENWAHDRQPILTVLHSIFSEGQSNGTFISSVPASEMTEIAITFLRGCSYSWCVKEGAFDIEERMQTLINIITHSFIDVMNCPIYGGGLQD